MSGTTTLADVFKSLPDAAVNGKPSLLAFNANGVPGRLTSASMQTVQRSSSPDVAIESEWTRVAILGKFTSGSHVFIGDIMVYTPWGSSAMTALHLSMALCTASWDYNKGNTTEKFTVAKRLDMTSPFTRGRIVVAAGAGDVKTMYLEVFRGSSSSSADYRRPYAEIRAVYDSTGTATPVTATAGAIPSGAIVKEFDF